MAADHPQFEEWKETERQAAEAERELYSKLCDCSIPCEVTQEELARVRQLRQRSSSLMRQMLSDLREAAESLKFRPASQSSWKN